MRDVKDNRELPFDPSNDNNAAVWVDTRSTMELAGERVQNVTVKKLIERKSKDLKTHHSHRFQGHGTAEKGFR